MCEFEFDRLELLVELCFAGLKAIGVPALVSGLEVAPGDDKPTEVAAFTTTPQQKPPRPGSKLAQLITMLMHD